MKKLLDVPSVNWARRFPGAVAVPGAPIRQSFINGLIPSEQRATVLSFDNLMGSAGGAVIQPVLGRVADVSGYAASYLVSSAITAVAVPFVWLARREHASADPIVEGVEPVAPGEAPLVDVAA